MKLVRGAKDGPQKTAQKEKTTKGRPKRASATDTAQATPLVDLSQQGAPAPAARRFREKAVEQVQGIGRRTRVASQASENDGAEVVRARWRSIADAKTALTAALAELVELGAGQGAAFRALKKEIASIKTEGGLAVLSRWEGRVGELLAQATELRTAAGGADPRRGVLKKVPALGPALERLESSRPGLLDRVDSGTGVTLAESLHDYLGSLQEIGREDVQHMTVFLDRVAQRRVGEPRLHNPADAGPVMRLIHEHPGLVLELARAAVERRPFEVKGAYPEDGARTIPPLNYLALGLGPSRDPMYEWELESALHRLVPPASGRPRDVLDGFCGPMAVAYSKLTGEALRYGYAHKIKDGKDLAKVLKDQGGVVALASVVAQVGKAGPETWEFPVFSGHDAHAGTVRVRYGQAPERTIRLDQLRFGDDVSGRVALYYRPGKGTAPFLTPEAERLTGSGPALYTADGKLQASPSSAAASPRPGAAAPKKGLQIPKDVPPGPAAALKQLAQRMPDTEPALALLIARRPELLAGVDEITGKNFPEQLLEFSGSRAARESPHGFAEFIRRVAQREFHAHIPGLSHTHGIGKGILMAHPGLALSLIRAGLEKEPFTIHGVYPGDGMRELPYLHELNWPFTAERGRGAGYEAAFLSAAVWHLAPRDNQVHPELVCGRSPLAAIGFEKLTGQKIRYGYAFKLQTGADLLAALQSQRYGVAMGDVDFASRELGWTRAHFAYFSDYDPATRTVQFDDFFRPSVRVSLDGLAFKNVGLYYEPNDGIAPFLTPEKEQRYGDRYPFLKGYHGTPLA